MQYLDAEYILSARHCECYIIPLPVNEQIFYAIKVGKMDDVFITSYDEQMHQFMFWPLGKRHIVVEVQLLGDNGELCRRMHFEMEYVKNNQNSYSIKLGHRVVWED